MLFSGSAMASDTRVMTMGENNMVLLDDANIWLFPSRIFEYPNLAVGEFGNYGGFASDEFAQFGIHWKFGSEKPFVLGTYFSDLPAAGPSDLAGGSLVPFDFILLENRRMDLLYARGLGGFNFGSRFSIYHSSQANDMAADQTKESFTYYDLDFGLTPTNGKWDLALNMAFGGWTDEDATGGTETDADGYMDFSVMGRYFMQRGPNYTFIPHAAFLSGKRGINEYYIDADLATLDVNSTYSLTGFDIGIGTNYTPAANVLAVCDFGFAYLKWKEEIDNQLAATSSELTETFMVLPYFKIGLDADVFKWMDVRLGATSFWTNETIDIGAGGKQKFNYAENDTYLGFGFHWGRLQVDTYTDPELFLQGFDFMSGTGDADMNFRITAVYEMM
jgi:hypothetical protein